MKTILLLSVLLLGCATTPDTAPPFDKAGEPVTTCDNGKPGYWCYSCVEHVICAK